jgi:hypothetical protein
MSNNFAIDDEFQELLDGLTIAPVVPGKRGGGRKATNNIGADVLGIVMLKELRLNYHVNLFDAQNLKGNTLWGVIDSKSFDRARQVSMNIEPSYSQVGILAISLSQNADKEIFVQWWKATVLNGILSFRKIDRKGEDYRLCQNLSGQYGLWKMDSTTGLPQERNEKKDYISFPYSTLVDFEAYLNAVAKVAEVPVSFPDGEIENLKGLSEILANVNLNTEVPKNSTTDEDDSLEDEFDEDEVGS